MDSWPDLRAGIVENLTAALILLVVGVIGGWVGQRLHVRRAAGRLLEFPDGQVHIVLAAPAYMTPSSAGTSPQASVPIATIGTVFAFRHLYNLLHIVRPRSTSESSVYFSADFPPSLLGDNLVCVGFPQTNLVSREILRRIELPVAIDGHEWIDQNSGLTYKAIIEDGHVVEDYGALVRLKNPFNEASVVYIFAGTQTYGMKAAAEFLSEENLLLIKDAWLPTPVVRRLPAAMRALLVKRERSQGYEILVQTHVNRYFTSTPAQIVRYDL
jgi:hypothetical protein